MVVCVPMPISEVAASQADWCVIATGPVPLRCWWAPASGSPQTSGLTPSHLKAVLVLPEVFGVNGWVRSVADRIAAFGVPALAMPLFARTAPDLELDYTAEALAEGRRHKEACSTEQILADVKVAITWLEAALRPAESAAAPLEITVVGFCFGGHAALLAASLPEVSHTFDFYGAGVVQGRPGGGAPSLELLPQVQGQLTCLCGTADPLIPEADRRAIAAALASADPSGERLRCVELAAADHGFMCEARGSFHAAASQRGWQLLRESLLA
jgi:carboxymethylenebutenolidase